MNPIDINLTEVKTVPDDAYYAGMTAGKMAAGLPMEDAAKVTAEQRAEDTLNGVHLEASTIPVEVTVPVQVPVPVTVPVQVPTVVPTVVAVPEKSAKK